MSNSEPPGENDTPETLAAGSRERANAWILVLTSQGIAARTSYTDLGYAVHVAPENLARANEIIRMWIRENQPREIPREARLPETRRPADFAVAYSLALCLLYLHFVMEQSDGAQRAYRIGSANAYEILAGEVWRVFTALTLHKNHVHVLGNTLIGGLFLASLSGRVGAGVAIALALVSGALGNLANAIYYQTGHNSIGASTAVFGVVGLLCGLEAWRRQRLALPWRGAWVPLGAGGGLLAMLGSGGGDVDYGAHIFGMLAGMMLGYLLASRISPSPPRALVQIGFGLGGLTVIGVSWASAYHFSG